MPESTLPEESLRNIVYSLTNGVLVVDEDSIVRFMNPAAEALLGRSFGDLVGSAFAHPVQDGGVSEIEIDGERIAEMRIARTRWDGRPAFVVSLHDVSTRARVVDLHHRLLLADKRAAIARLSTSIAHEINNPAAFILANLAVMRDIADDFEAAFDEARTSRTILDKYQIAQSLDDLRDMVKDNEIGIERIRSFVRELRALAQEAGAPIERVDLNQVVASACDVATATVGRRVQLVCELGQMPEIAADRLRLTQVVLNLILNAAEATAGDRARDRVEVATSSDDESVRIAVRDTGRGVPEEHIDKIFDPLFVIDPAEGTLGMGLAVSSEIVSHHGGRIEVSSQAGEKTCFEIVLPRDTGLLPAEPGADATPGQVRARVLLVEDDNLMRRSIRRMLEPFHDVVEAAGGKAALEIVAQDRDYDVVLCALSMSEMDGPALFDRLQDGVPELAARTIFIGDSTIDPRIRRFVASSRAMVLDKPVSRTLLCDVIERWSR